MSNNYRDLLKQIEDLKLKAEQVRSQEVAEVIKDIKAMMAEYGITAADLGLAGGPRKATAARTAAVKYRHPQSGETWSGKGRTPKWVLEWENAGRQREELNAH